jgi:hypothetical protein
MSTFRLKQSSAGIAHIILPIIVMVIIALLGGIIYEQVSKAATTSGDYFESGVSATKCLDDFHDGTANYTEVEMYNCNKSTAQEWTIEANGTIENANGACLDLSGAVYTNNTKIVVYRCNTSPAQQWKYVSDVIRNPTANKCLDDPYSNITNNTQLIVYTCKGTNNQKWNAVASGTTPVTTQQSQTRQFGYSIHGVGLSSTDLGSYLQLVKASKATTVRDDFQWANIETSSGVYNWTATDQYMTMTAEDGLNVLAVADYAPSWETGNTSSTHVAPKNASDYGIFVQNIAERYGPNGTFWKQNPTLPYRALSGIEIWNEPNNSVAWANPNPATYTAIAKAAYADAKKVMPTVPIIAGALSACQSYGYVGSDCTNPVTFLQDMYADGVSGSFDALSAHPYSWGPGLTASYILTTSHTWSAWSQMASTSVSLRSLMVANGDANKKIWITEIGAPTYSAGVSAAEQANLATQSIATWKSYSWAGNYYWYDIKDDCTDTSDPECNYGAIETNGTPKPVYQMLTNAYSQ